MTSLKTLKDVNYKNDDYSLIVVKDLRFEAIQWVNYLKQCPNHNIGLVMWIISFFDITREELK